MSAVCRWMPKLRTFGPYLLMELLLPGGTLIALLVWLSQGMTRSSLTTIDRPVVAPRQVEKVIASTNLQSWTGAHA
jgi:hypothetical protein